MNKFEVYKAPCAAQYVSLSRIMPAPAFPPFPDNVPTHPLLVVDYELIKRGDEAEKDKLWEAATKLGFW